MRDFFGGIACLIGFAAIAVVAPVVCLTAFGLVVCGLDMAAYNLTGWEIYPARWATGLFVAAAFFAGGTGR